MLNRYILMVDDPGASWKSHTLTQVNIDEIRLCFLTKPEINTKEYEKQRELLEIIRAEYLAAISAMPEEIFSGILTCASKVCNSLDYALQLLSTQTPILGRTLDVRLSLVLEQDMINRLLTEDIAQLLRIPEIQKNRLVLIEQAFKCIQNAFYDTAFDKQALQYLLEAEKSEPSDYVVLYFVGMIYLYSTPCMDLPKAESYFRKAAIFSKLDTKPNAFKLADIVKADLLKYNSSVSNNQKTQYIAAESFFQAALASFIQRKQNEAVELFTTALELVPEMHEAGYYACVSNALVGNKESTLKSLGDLVEKMPLYAVVAACDPMLASLSYVQEWMSELKQNTINEASRLLDEIEGHMLKSSIHENDLQSVRVKLYEADYLDADEMLTSLKYKWTVLLKKEQEEYETNKEKVSFVKGIIFDSNKIVMDLKKNTSSHVPIIKGIDPKVTDEFDTLLSLNYLNPVDQSQLTEKIAAIIHSLDKRYEENIHEIEVARNNLVEKRSDLESVRLRKAENLGHLNMFVAGIAPFIAVLFGFLGYFLTPETLGNEDEYMLPWINFFIGLIIASSIFVIVYLIIRVVKRRQYESSLPEIDLEKEMTILDEFIVKFNEIKMLLYT